MPSTFYFYDLETSGFYPRSDAIMQFAGLRTDLNLKPLGDEINELISLPKDMLPEPGAVLITGITPQKTLESGLNEAEFLKEFYSKAVKPDTIFVGFNNIRFDDEFMRFINFRNFYDPYAWAWQNNCSRWDLLDVVRMTRALRPEGISWPIKDGKPNNQLENLTKANKLAHSSAHDAMSDVKATVSVAKLIKSNQPKIFDFLLGLRSKSAVKNFVEHESPFVYCSSHYPSEYLHTSVVAFLGTTSDSSALVYDLRHDPSDYLKMSEDELIEAWQYREDRTEPRLPVKSLRYNRVPAIAPLSVINSEQITKHLSLDMDSVKKNLAVLEKNKKEFTLKMLRATEKMDKARETNQTSLDLPFDQQLYSGFINNVDSSKLVNARKLGPDINVTDVRFQDKRLNSLIPIYKARNYPKKLSSSENQAWQQYLEAKLSGKNSKLEQYFNKISQLRQTVKSKDKEYLLEELELYGQSIAQELEGESAAH